MRLRRARVQNYRSVRDSGWFDIDPVKTIFVGPNEGGKTAILRALEHLNPGRLVRLLEPLRDFPRSEYHQIQSGRARPADLVVAEAEYDLDDDERALLQGISPLFAQSRYYRAVRLDNTIVDRVLHAPDPPAADELSGPLRRLAAYADSRMPGDQMGGPGAAGEQLERYLEAMTGSATVSPTDAARLVTWLDQVVSPHIDRENPEQVNELLAMREVIGSVEDYLQVLEALRRRVPVMVYVSTYPSVTPILHLGHLADAMDNGAIDPTDEYNFGNSCLLSLLGFTARQLSDLGKAKEPEFGDTGGFERYRSQLDERDAALNAASLRLTNHIKAVWRPSRRSTDDQPASSENFSLRITADQQYLKMVVEDSLGTQIELDQRSQGFKWLTSFFVVFFAQASERTNEAVLLLDEPGLSLHGLKQREFRHTLSTLGDSNQLLFTTHSPFLIGPDELPLVRVVELFDRVSGTKVHSDLRAEDPASLLPIQEALSYDLAAELFAAKRALLVESLADCWYIQATAALLADAGMAALAPDVEVLPVGDLTKVAYLSTLLETGGLQVAALLDADTRGPLAEAQDKLVELLGSERIVRTKDVYSGMVPTPRVDELLRETLVGVGQEAGWDVTAASGRDWGAVAIDDIFARAGGDSFTPYRLAKEYVRWTRDHRAADLAADERVAWMHFLERVSRALA